MIMLNRVRRRLALAVSIHSIALWILLGASADAAWAQSPLFRFGVIADVQYADINDQANRSYRGTLAHLKDCLADFSKQDLAFTVQLGDIINGNTNRSEQELSLVMDVFRASKAPVRHVVGNHCLEVPAPALLKALGLESGYYSFSHDHWRFLVLNCMEVSVKSPTNSPSATEAAERLDRNPKLVKYNGALGARQRAWLQEQIDAAERNRDKVVLFTHHPLVGIGKDTTNVIWDQEDVMKVLIAHKCVVAWFNGHAHEGGYSRKEGIHCVTLQGMVEAPAASNAYGVVEVYPNKLVLRGAGQVPSRTLDVEK